MTNQEKATRCPDLCANAAECYGRESFRVDDRVFKRTEPGAYTDGKIIAYCHQQDSTSWGARGAEGAGRKLRTGYFWHPEYAVGALLDGAKAVLG
jgi:hypothetical protein